MATTIAAELDDLNDLMANALERWCEQSARETLGPDATDETVARRAMLTLAFVTGLPSPSRMRH